MEHNQDAAQRRRDPSAADESAEGRFEVGDEIRGQGASPERPDVAAVTDRGADSSQAPVVGDNDGVSGDADAMTSGDSADPRPDDTAQRPWGLATDSGT